MNDNSNHAYLFNTACLHLIENRQNCYVTTNKSTKELTKV